MKQTFKKLIKSYNICRLNLRFKSLLIILFSFLQIFCAETDSQVVTCQSEPEYVQSLPSLPGSFHNYPITAKKLDKNVTSVIQNHINKFLIGDDTELSEEFNSALNLKLGLEKGWRVKEYKATSDSKYLIVLATVCDNSNRIPSCLKGRDVISRIYIIDLTKGNILKIIEYLDQICHLALSPTNEYFAVYYDYHVYVYDIQSVLSVNFQEKYKLKIPYDLSNEEDDVFSIREILHLSADGNFIIIHFTQKASFDPDTVIRLANVRIYNIQTGEQLINSGSADEDSIPLNNFEAKFIGKTNIVCVMSDTSIFIYNVQDKKKIFTSSFYNFGYNHQETLNDITNYGYFLKISESSITIYNINEKLEETIELDDKYKKIIIKAKDFFVVLTENDSLILYDFQNPYN